MPTAYSKVTVMRPQQLPLHLQVLPGPRVVPPHPVQLPAVNRGMVLTLLATQPVCYFLSVGKCPTVPDTGKFIEKREAERTESKGSAEKGRLCYGDRFCEFAVAHYNNFFVSLLFPDAYPHQPLSVGLTVVILLVLPPLTLAASM